VFYAKAGVIDEAEKEFRKLIKQNPQSAVPTKLRRSVRFLF
jgi:hypothetical protein